MLIDNIPLESVEYEFILCKPDGTQLCMLEDIYDVEYEAKFPTTDQLKFKVPYYINRNGQQVVNVSFDLIKGKYLVLMNRKLGDAIQLSKYFIIQNPRYIDDEKTIKDIYCYSREHELNSKIIRGYNFISRKLYSITNEKDENGEHVGVFNHVNELSNWKIDEDSFTSNADLLMKFRAFDVSEKSLFDFLINDVQKAFDCIFLFDKVDRKISVTTFEKLNSNNGMYISQDNYIKSINQEIKIEDVVTRLHAYGANDISINGVTLTGTTYIDDFSYFMTTDYMSQDLIDALTNYYDLIEYHETQETHKALNDRLKVLLEEYQILTNELHKLTDGYTDNTGAYIKGLLDLKHEKDGLIKQNEDLTGINLLIKNKELEVLNKQAQIDHEIIDEEILANHPTFDYSGIVSKQSEIDSVLGEIRQFNDLISMYNNLTTEQINELNDYIFEGTYTNSSCETEEDLLEEAQKELKRLCTPPLEFDIDSVDFLNAVNGGKLDKRRLNLGDVVTIELKQFAKDLEVRLIGYTHGIDGNSLNLQFSNKASMESSYDFFSEIQKEAKTTTVSLNMSKPKIDKLEKTESEVRKFINGSLEASKNAVLAGKNQDIKIDEFGIHLREHDEATGGFKSSQMRLINNMLVISDDSFNTAKLAITPSGVVGETIVGKILAGENLTITTGNGDFTVDTSGVTIKGTSLNIIANDGISNLVDYWNSVEQKAKDYTNQEVGEVDTALTELNNSFTEAFSDSTITSIEANVLKNNLEQVKKESADLIVIARDSLGIVEEVTFYSDSLTELETEINKWINQVSYPLTVTTTDRTNINTKFSNVQDKKSILINKISEVRENNATSVANAAQESANQAQADADTANSKLSDIASDSKLTPSEKQDTQKEWDIIVSEKPTLENQADLYGVITEKISYTTTYENLDTYILPLLTDLSTTSDIVGSTFRDKFKDYYDARTVLLNKIADVTKSIADGAQETADNAWSKFSGVGNTLPSGNVEFNFAGSDSKGGNAIDTDKVNGVSSSEITSNIQKALDDASTAQDTADGKITSYYQTTAPATGNEGDLWFDTDNGNKIYTYRSGAWVDSQDSKIGEALDSASDAQAIADKKVQSFFSATTPTAESIGDLWYNTSTYELKRWNGSSWVLISDVTGQKTSNNTKNVGNQSATDVQDSVLNFNNRNDRNSTTPANPAILSDGTAIDHTINTDGSANISFEWSYNGTGDAYDIDGFIVYVHQSANSTAHTFGTSTINEQVFYITPEKRGFILYGVPSNQFYTFGVQAYRVVDQDVSNSGTLSSSIVKSSFTSENPYMPSTEVSFNGNITGTVDGVSASAIREKVDNSVQKDETINGVKIDTTNGLTVTRGDDKVRSVFNSTEGIKIQYRTDTLEEWNSSHDKLYIDTDGNLIANNINANGGVFSGTVTASNFTLNGGTFNAADIVGGSINIGNGVFEVDTNGKLYSTGAQIEGELKTQYNNKTVAHLYRDLNGGGYLKINGYDSSLNVEVPKIRIGSEGFNLDNRGGTFLLYDDDEAKVRAEFGIVHAQSDTTDFGYGGAINLRGDSGTSRVSIYASSNLGSDGVIVLLDELEQSKVLLRGNGSCYIDSGNVAIGKKTALYKLDVSGAIRSTSDIYASNFIYAEGSKKVATEEYVNQKIQEALGV